MASVSGNVESSEVVAMEADATSPAPEAPANATSKSPRSGSVSGSLLKDFSLCRTPTQLLPFMDDALLASVLGTGSTGQDEGFEVVSDDRDQMETAEPEGGGNNPFVSAAIAMSQLSRTENNAVTYSSSGDSRLDFFFVVMEQTGEERTLGLLENSWNENPLHTLRLLANLRDIRGGKGIRVQYQQCLYWLYQNHPATLYHNLEELLGFGYCKDVLELLVIIMFDGFMDSHFQKDALTNPKMKARRKINPPKSKVKRFLRQEKQRYVGSTISCPIPNTAVLPPNLQTAKDLRMAYDKEKRVLNQKIVDFYKLNVQVRDMEGKEMNMHRLAFAREKLENDAKYRAFHLKIADLFAAQLISDLKVLRSSEKKKDISLAAKWAPTLEKHFDKYTLIGSTIALKIAERTGTSGKAAQVAVATYLARKTYNKEYLIPLRRNLEVPEVPMSEQRWNEVNYARVPAKCMDKNKAAFLKHDQERFESYLSDSKTKVAGASLKPVEIICQAMRLNISSNEAEKTVLEKQWISLVESLKKGGKLLDKAVCICDVSGSMSGEPMEAAIGLTLITMQLTKPPWSRVCITFSENPELFHLPDGLSLTDKLYAMRGMPWGGTTNVQKAFELVLSLGKKNGLKQEDMPKVLFVFTDMEFDQAFYGNGTMTNFEAAKKRFEAEGYKLPTVVFWNLRDSGGMRGDGKSTPVRKNDVGALLLSGFSAQTLSLVLDAKDLEDVSPMRFLLEVVEHERYSMLKIYD